MAISLNRPILLLLMPIAFLLTFYFAGKLKNMYAFKKRLVLILRNLVFSLLILSLAGPNIKWIVDTTSTVFVIDASDSMSENREKAEAFIKSAVENKGHKDDVGVAAFGENALVESFVSHDMNFSKVETDPKGRFTNIEAGIASAISMLQKNSKKRIVLITDGEENVGNSLKHVPSLLNENINLEVYKMQRDVNNEVAVDSVTLPQRINLGEEFNITVNISSTVNTSAVLSLFSGREKISGQKVRITKGGNRFIFRDRAENGGFISYRAVIEPDIDKEIKNNEVSSFTNIADRPMILIVEDKADEGKELTRMLEVSGMNFKRLNAAAAPTTLEEMMQYKSIILCNVSAENLSTGFLNSIESYVKDFGGGLIASGGDDSFALGGYFKTPLEKVLPVNMHLKGRKEIPDMSIMLIIDKSGSMTEGSGGITKLDIAKEAAARSLDSLRAKDEIGVLTFDDTAYWVVERQKSNDTERIKEDIGTIRSGGGTSILPALDEGYLSLKKSNAKIKHIILLTDGQAEKAGYEELVNKIKGDNITVSTVAVGQDADTSLLQNIAMGAGGRFYYTDQYTNIPTIFAKETFMAAKAYINNREFTPYISSSHQILQGVAEEGLASLLGYVGASPKDTSRVILSSDEQDPILTVWQYGLGKTAAWNSDISGRWSANYINWDKNISLWQNIINFTVESYEDQAVTLETSMEGNKGIITLINNEDRGQLESKATIVNPSLESKEINLYPTEPGKFVGSFDIKEQGVYIIKGRQEKAGEVVYASNSGLSAGYSPEYKIQPPNNTVERLVKESGGVFITKPEDVFSGKLKDVFGSLDITSYLIAAAIILFMLDIALRRLNLPLHKLEARFKSFNVRIKPLKNKYQPLVKSKEIDLKEEILVEKQKSEKKETKTTGMEDLNAEQKQEKQVLDTSMLLRKKSKK